MFKDMVDSATKEIMDHWRIETALKHGFMEDVEGAIREAFIRGISYGGMDPYLCKEALTVCKEMDKEYVE